MNSYNIPGLTAGVIFGTYILPIILLIWLGYEVSRYYRSATRGRPLALAIAVSFMILYISAWAGGFHKSSPGVVSEALVVVVLGAGIVAAIRKNRQSKA